MPRWSALFAPVAAVVALIGLPATSAAKTSPFLPITHQYLKMPKGVQPWLPVYTADGRNIVFRSQSDKRIWITGRDGKGTKCVTCGFADQPANLSGGGFTYAFPDGKRLFLASKELGASGGSDLPSAADAYVLECAPSITRCATHKYVPVDMSADKGASFIVQRRTWHLAPDGVHLGWMDVRLDGTAMVVAKLQRQADRYLATNARVVNPPGPTSPADTSADRWENGSQLYELKSFADGGRSILAVGEQMSNTDVYKINLASGKTTRTTANLDWDEDGAEAPDGRSQVVESWRTRNRLGVTSWIPQLRDFIGLQLGAALAPYYVSTWQGFQCDLSPWLLPAGGDRGGKLIGQPLDTYSGNLTAANNLTGLDSWSPDSTSVLLQEKLRTPPAANANEDVKQKGYTPNRVAVARIGRAGTRRQKVGSSGVGAWAPTASGFKGTLSGDRTAVVKGEKGGTATIVYAGSIASGSTSVTFNRFTDDGKTFVDGTQSAATRDATSKPWTIKIAIRVSGANTGRMDADLSVDNSTKPLPTKSGTWTAVYNGRKAPALPNLGPCYSKLPKPTRLAVTAKRTKRGARVKVTADIAGDTRAVRNATVRIGGRRKKTDANGRVGIRLSPRCRASHVTATAGDTFLRGTARIRR